MLPGIQFSKVECTCTRTGVSFYILKINTFFSDGKKVKELEATCNFTDVSMIAT